MSDNVDEVEEVKYEIQRNWGSGHWGFDGHNIYSRQHGRAIINKIRAAHPTVEFRLVKICTSTTKEVIA